MADSNTKYRPYPSGDPQLVYELARERLLRQLNQSGALDSKVGLYWSLATAILAITAGLIGVQAKSFEPEVAIKTLLLGAGFYIVLTLASLLALHVRTWSIGPKVEEAWKYAREPNFAINTQYWWAAESYTSEFSNNLTSMRIKIWTARLAPVLVMAQIALLVIIAFLTVFA